MLKGGENKRILILFSLCGGGRLMVQEVSEPLHYIHTYILYILYPESNTSYIHTQQHFLAPLHLTAAAAGRK